jgi:hypothetical protein
MARDIDSYVITGHPVEYNINLPCQQSVCAGGVCSSRRDFQSRKASIRAIRNRDDTVSKNDGLFTRTTILSPPPATWQFVYEDNYL